jgi:hypothetical protein
VDEEQTAAANALGVARAVHAVVMLAAAGGMAIDAVRSLLLDFDPSGDVVITLTTTDGTTDEATLTADAIKTACGHGDDDRASVPPPPPAA